MFIVLYGHAKLSFKFKSNLSLRIWSFFTTQQPGLVVEYTGIKLQQRIDELWDELDDLNNLDDI